MHRSSLSTATAVVAAVALALLVQATAVAQTTSLYWGDTHLHTKYSVDAYLMQNRSADPDVAYRYARGLPVIHPYHRARVQIETPLDFLVVSDHAELMTVTSRLLEGDEELGATETGQRILDFTNTGQEREAFYVIVGTVNEPASEESQVVLRDFNREAIRRSAWELITDAADRNNVPGEFTAFIGWEWTSLPGGANLHRVVFMSEGAEVANQFLPYSMLESDRPEDLWSWLDTTSEQVGASFVAIPHNSNISKGLMFNDVDSDGRPITAEYARTRLRWEPVVEITQIKGDSETHPLLSPDDEFADFEPYEHVIAVGEHAAGEYVAVAADYVRSALLRGLQIEAQVGANPYQVGVVGSTDSHTAMPSAEEDNFHGKMAIDSIPDNLLVEVTPGSSGIDMSAAGLAAVWAQENTRESLLQAFRRREVYGSTGPRIQVRFFGGWSYEAAQAEAVDLASVGYANGVPMGGELTAGPEGQAPSFLIHAVRDPVGGNLDRIQVVKGWLDAEGASHEQVYNVAVSDGREIGADGSVAPVGNTVDLATARYTNDIGDAQLATVWTDPEFDPSQRAFYYLRVLQIPTPRHSLFDAIALGIEHPEGHPPTIQERAYSSPIWYTP